MSDILTEVLKLIGGVAVIGTASSAIAYLLFRTLATKWIESRFSERLEAFKHQQDQEIEHLRFRINTMMDQGSNFIRESLIFCRKRGASSRRLLYNRAHHLGIPTVSRPQQNVRRAP
jgi:hypothetical protein